jgi:histidinol-phosphate aminotransferase
VMTARASSAAASPAACSPTGSQTKLAWLSATSKPRSRSAAVVTERTRLTAALRERGLDVADSQANFVWLPLGEETAGLAAALEARAVITRPFAGEGIRVTVGTPEEDDVFLAALDEVRASGSA